MNYSIIQDEKALIDFIDWLPELAPNEKYYCCLFSRKKYTQDLTQQKDKAQLRRFLSDKQRLLEKIRQLEVAKGAYQIGGKAIEEDSLALYINPNPRDLKAATFEGIMELTRQLKNNAVRMNPHSEMLSCIQRSVSRKIYLDFDVDQKPFDLEQLKTIINEDCLEVLETRGGYHLLIRVEDIDPKYKASFYKEITSLGVDQVGDQLLPVPGCLQGGFVPRFVSL